MDQLTFSLEEPLANLSVSLDCVKGLKTQEAISCLPMLEFLTSLDPSGAYGKTCQVSSVQTEDGILVPSSGRWSNSGMGSAIGCLMLNTLEYHKDAEESSLLDVLETGSVPQRFFLSPKACAGIIRRAKVRNKTLPPLLLQALEATVKESGQSELLEETLEADQKP